MRETNLYKSLSTDVACRRKMLLNELSPASPVWLRVLSGGFPTQVIICDLKRERMMRGIVLSEGHDMWDCTPRCLTTELPQFMLWALSMNKSNYSSLPKVTRFHRTTIQYVKLLHVRTVIHLSTFITTNWILLLNYGVVTLQLLHGFKQRLKKWNSSLFCR